MLDDQLPIAFLYTRTDLPGHRSQPEISYLDVSVWQRRDKYTYEWKAVHVRSEIKMLLLPDSKGVGTERVGLPSFPTNARNAARFRGGSESNEIARYTPNNLDLCTIICQIGQFPGATSMGIE